MRATIKHFRIPEIVLMSGFALIGSVHAWSRGARADATQLLSFVLGVFALFLAIYSYNSSADHAADETNARLRSDGRPSASSYRSVAFVSVAVAMGLLALCSVAIAVAGLLSFLLWALYSQPVVGLKHRRGAGTLAHVIGEMLHFAMGSAALGLVDATTLSTSVYFALLFAAGHLFHEVIDVEADRAAGVTTTAVSLGVSATSLAAHAVFALAALYLALLLALGVVLASLAVPFLAAGLAHAGLVAVRVRRHGSVDWVALRSRYRACYLMAGAAFVASQLRG